VASCDAVIIGGGIIGASVALELARHHLRVILLDRAQPGREASWAAAGMLSPVPDTPDGLPLVPLASASFDLYPDFVAEVESASGLSVNYRTDGALELFFSTEAEHHRDRLVAQYAQLGLPAETISLDRARQLEPASNPAARAAAWLPSEASVDPRALMDALLKACASCGVLLRAGEEVVSVARDAVGRALGVHLAAEQIFAKYVVVAAGCFSGRIGWLGDYAPTRPARGQMVALRSADVCLRRVLRSGEGYLVPRGDRRIVAGSTIENAGFQKAVTPAGLTQILSAALRLAPSLAGAEIIETWSGLRPDTPDHLPILGPCDKEGLLFATGHYRNGILLAPITAQLVREWILSGKTSLEVTKFLPGRFPKAVESAQSNA
jgi:glycine oxidase